MSQRCSYCGKTRKQHNKPCVDVEAFKRALGPDPAEDGPEVGLVIFFRCFPEGSVVPYPLIWKLC